MVDTARTGDLFDGPPTDWPEERPGLKAAWWEFHRANPHVYAMFKRFTFEVLRRHTHYSARAVVHRMRWHTSIEVVNDDEFKINNNHTPYYARLFMKDFPLHEGFFRTRETKSAVRSVGGPQGSG